MVGSGMGTVRVRTEERVHVRELACACSAGAGEYWSKQPFAHLFATKCAANATFYGSGVTLWISGDTGFNLCHPKSRVSLLCFFLQICEVRLRCAFLRLRCAFLRLRCDFLRLQCAFLRLPCAPVAYLPATTLPAFAAPAAGLLQPQRAVPDHRRARPLAFSRRLSAQSRSRRAYSAIGATSPPQAPRDGSAHSCGSTRTYGATPPRGLALPMAATGAAPPPACCLCLSQPCDPSANAHLERDVRSRCDWQQSRR